jgi:hypothetical protein
VTMTRKMNIVHSHDQTAMVSSVMPILVRPLATGNELLYFAYNRLGSHIAIEGT